MTLVHDTVRDMLGISDPNTRIHCPNWPPDVFCIIASLLQRSGVYKHVVSLGTHLAPDPRKTTQTARQWVEYFADRTIQEDLPKQDSYSADLLPERVTTCWNNFWSLTEDHQVIGHMSAYPSQETESTDHQDFKYLSQNMDAIAVALELLAIADSACHGCGKSPANLDNSGIKHIALFIMMLNNQLSLCWEIQPNRGRVLPKVHTPSCGLTLRSMSHNACYIPPGEVSARWFAPIELEATTQLKTINFLLLPWPLTLAPSDFKRATPKETLADGFGYFEFERKAIPDFEERLSSLLDQAKGFVDKVHGVILPELSLTRDDFETLLKVGRKYKTFICSGIQEGNRNFLAMDFAGLAFNTPPESASEDGKVSLDPFFYHEQSKHHRWYLEKNQIMQYGLGGFLPIDGHWWEYAEIGNRSIDFVSLDHDLTFCPLICEDLARQDPIADVIRCVAPNLVIALLMDGPQLGHRWPARYASVLAEDPGCSVLSLTSFGMVQLSNREGRSSRVVALWTDKLSGPMELSLPEHHDALLLSLCPSRSREVTADGRLDVTSQRLVYAGHTSLWSDIKPPPDNDPQNDPH